MNILFGDAILSEGVGMFYRFDIATAVGWGEQSYIVVFTEITIEMIIPELTSACRGCKGGKEVEY